MLYGPELTLSLPAAVSVTSGMNAIAYAVEALYAPDASPIISLMAEEGARSLAAALPAVAADGKDLPARADAQYGAWLCGACLGATTMSLHHKLCPPSAARSTCRTPRHTPSSCRTPSSYNQPAAPDAAAALRQALGGAADPATALWELARGLAAPGSLRELGMEKNDISRIVEQTPAHPYANPRRSPRTASPAS